MSAFDPKRIPTTAALLAALLLLASCGGDDGTGPDPGDDGYHHPPDVEATRATGSLHAGRNQHTATLLQDGRVLVTGGWNGVDLLASCEIYDPRKEEWTVTASMGLQRALHTATLMADGRVFVCGGTGEPDRESIVWFEVFDPVAETWTEINFDNDPPELDTYMLNTRYAHTATLMPDGRILIAGGYSSHVRNDLNTWGDYLSTYEFYDPAAHACRHATEYEFFMIRRRYCHSATLLNDGTVLIAGGFNNEDDYHGYCEIYHPDTDRNELTGQLLPGRMGHTSQLLNDGRVLVAGGSVGLNATTRECHVYDPATETWTATGSLHVVRKFPRSAKLPDGRVVLAGNTAADDAEIWDPATGEWSWSSDMTEIRYLHTMTTLANGVILIVGGLDITGGDDYLEECELYVPGEPEA